MQINSFVLRHNERAANRTCVRLHCSVPKVFGHDKSSNGQKTSTKSGKLHFDVNSEAALGILHAGMGYSHLNKFLGCVNAPPLYSKMFKKHDTEIGPIVQDVAKESCKKWSQTAITSDEVKLDPIKLIFYTERYEKENRRIKLVEEFVPLYRKSTITGKFYAKHEAVTTEEHIPEEYTKLIERRTETKPNDIYSFRPPSVNMDYGWFADPLIPRSKDPRLYFPLKHCDFIETEINIRQIDQGKIKEKFVGVPFKL